MQLTTEEGPVWVGREEQLEPLTTPSSAKPEPTLIMVGMMSNFPACIRQEGNQSVLMG